MKRWHSQYARQLSSWTKPQYLIIVAIVFGAISIVSLRQNNLHMVRLRDTVYAADKSDGDVEGALRNLRQYVYDHMNTSLASGPNAVHPPIQLKYTYERLQQSQQNTLGKGNSTLYNDAQAYCNSQTTIGSEVITCIQSYAAEHGGGLQTVPDSLYKFDFTSVKWSPDVAGLSLVFASVALLGAAVSFVYRWWQKG